MSRACWCISLCWTAAGAAVEPDDLTSPGSVHECVCVKLKATALLRGSGQLSWHLLYSQHLLYIRLQLQCFLRRAHTYAWNKNYINQTAACWCQMWHCVLRWGFSRRSVTCRKAWRRRRKWITRSERQWCCSFCFSTTQQNASDRWEWNHSEIWNSALGLGDVPNIKHTEMNDRQRRHFEHFGIFGI